MINRKRKNIYRVAHFTPSRRNVEANYADVFDDALGMLPDFQHLDVDPSVKPVIMPDRQIPISVCPELKAELDRLIQKNIIVPMNQPTPWANLIVMARKNTGDGANHN